MSTRDRMIEAATEALRHRGVAGMSFTEVLEMSGAARGAIYHHFPGGKSELIAEAVRRNGQDVLAAVGEISGATPGECVAAFLAGVRPVLELSAQGGGCAVAAATVDLDHTSSTLREIAADAFAAWTTRLAQALTTTGMDSAKALDLAGLLITVLEGAHVMCRASRDLKPFDEASRAMLSLVHSLAAAR